MKTLANSKILLSESPFANKKQKSALIENLFEQQEVSQLFFGIQGVFSLYGVGMIEGVVLESGEGVTQVVPVYNGTRLEYVTER